MSTDPSNFPMALPLCLRLVFRMIQILLPMEQAEISIAINVGAFDDPPQFQGMAHFLEHMIFQGTEKFPAENGFLTYLANNGGAGYNGMTGEDMTIFYFSVVPHALKEGLERILDMVVAPLLTLDSLRRERDAVDAEFRIGFSSNSRRVSYLLNSLAKKDHPVKKNRGGNIQTLSGNDDSEVQTAMRNFLRKQYVASAMTLAVRSAEHDLDTMQSWVVEFFQQVPTGNVTTIKHDESLNAPFETEAFKKLYRVQSANSDQKVILTWSLPSMRDKVNSKPYVYVKKIIEREGPGSISHYLKKRNWATKLQVRGASKAAESINLYYSHFSVQVSLTNKGMDHLDEVTDAIFSYLNMLRQNGPQEEYFKEMQAIQESEFHLMLKTLQPREISTFMQRYEPKYFLKGDHLIFKYDPDAIVEFISHLRHNNVNVMVLDHHFKGQFDHKEKWLGTAYNVEDIPANWTSSWETALPLDSYTLPRPNPYLTNDFEIYNPGVFDFHPKMMEKNKLGELWIKKEGFSPNAYVFVHLLTAAMIFISPFNTCMFDLMSNAWERALATEKNLAQAAGFSSRVIVGPAGIDLLMEGYSQKLPELFDNILLNWGRFEDDLVDHEFENIKSELMQNYINVMLDPLNISNDLLQSAINPDFVSTSEKYNTMETITLEELKTFSKIMRRRVSYKILCIGNLRENHALEIKQKLEKYLQADPIVTGISRMNRLAQVPGGESIIIAQVPWSERATANSVYTKVLFCGPSNIRDESIAEILKFNIAKAAFDFLRTRWQLGYFVGAAIPLEREVLMITILVASSEDINSIGVVDKRVQSLVHEFYTGLKNLTQEQFEEMKANAKTRLQVVSQDWEEIKSEQRFFNRTDVKLHHLDLITLNETINWYENCAINKDHMRILTAAVKGHVATDVKPNLNQTEREGSKIFWSLIDLPSDMNRSVSVVSDLDEFRKSLYYYPQRASGN